MTQVLIVTKQSIAKVWLSSSLNLAEVRSRLHRTYSIENLLANLLDAMPRFKKMGAVSLAHSKHKIFWIMTHEKIASKIQDKAKQLTKTWTPWATYMKIRLDDKL